MGSFSSAICLVLLIYSSTAMDSNPGSISPAEGKLLLVHEVEPVELVELEELQPVELIRPGVPASSSTTVEKRLGKQYSAASEDGRRVRRIRPQQPVPVVQPPTQPQVARQGNPDDMVSGRTIKKPF